MSLNEIYDEAIFYSAWTYSSEFPRRSFMKTKIQAANNYKLTINEGEVLCFVGRPEIGKTEIMQELLKTVSRSTNDFLNVTDEHKDYKNDVAMIYQNHKLFPWLTVIENIAFGLIAREFHDEMIAGEVRSLLYQYDLWEVRDLYPSQLTTEEKQRTVIAQVMSTDPSVILMDEPFINLDYQSKEKFQGIIEDLCTELRKTVLLTTRSLEDALLIADRIILLDKIDSHWVIEECIVPLERPRDVTSLEFNNWRRNLRSIPNE